MYSPLPAALVRLLAAAGLFPASLTDRDVLLRLLQRLHPVETGHPLVRLGGEADGGYLVPDDLAGIAACYAAGVGDDSRFERDCAERGIDVFLADGSVDAPAEPHARFRFAPTFIGGMTADRTMTLDSWVASDGPSTRGDLLLKIDIEGAEYEALLAASEDLLARCRIVVVEFHNLHHLWIAAFFRLGARCFEKLLRTHACVHIHPNNGGGGVLRHRGLEVPRAMEFTFLRLDRLPPRPVHRSDFPHALDRDNTPGPPVTLPRCWFR